MKILLTGATGFIGNHLLENFIAQGHEVIVARRAGTNLAPLENRFGPLAVFDIEADDFNAFFDRHAGIDAVVHVATDYGRDPEKPLSAFWANEVFPMKLLEAATRGGVRQFINFDTFFSANKAVYDHLGAYTLSKRHFQEWGKQFSASAPVAFVNLRLFHVYGPGDGAGKFVPAMVARCMAGESIDLSDGLQKRDFIHVHDLVSALKFVLESRQHAGGFTHYDVGTGQSASIREFMETMREVCGGHASLNFGVIASRAGEFADAKADISALSALGWKPQVDIRSGIKTIVDAAIGDRAR
jgi:CDP-paratose synthetase